MMSASSIPERVKTRLWGRAAGRCEYAGCNIPLWLDSLTKFEFNVSYIAHIVADNPDGPRGDAVLSENLRSDISNLMLLCDAHHRLIDQGDVEGHPVERLRSMKAAHEQRIEIQSGLSEQKHSHIVLYGANIGQFTSPVSHANASSAMVPDRYPADSTPISIGMVNSSFEDSSDQFWQIEGDHLRKMVLQQIRPRIAHGGLEHLSVFALAPQPLLILLGSLLSDLQAIDVYQLHREPRGWRWQDEDDDIEYAIIEPSAIVNPPALVLSISGTITNDRIAPLFDSEVSIWRLEIGEPHNDFLKSKEQARKFRQLARRLLDRIKEVHGEGQMLHVFPAMPAALAVELGRILSPKADLSLAVYDQNKALGGFRFALNINQEQAL